MKNFLLINLFCMFAFGANDKFLRDQRLLPYLFIAKHGQQSKDDIFFELEDVVAALQYSNGTIKRYDLAKVSYGEFMQQNLSENNDVYYFQEQREVCFKLFLTQSALAECADKITTDVVAMVIVELDSIGGMKRIFWPAYVSKKDAAMFLNDFMPIGAERNVFMMLFNVDESKKNLLNPTIMDLRASSDSKLWLYYGR